MVGLKRGRMLLLPMSFAVTLLSLLTGCGGESDDLARAADGTPRRTPSEIQQKAQAKNANQPRPATQATTPKWAAKSAKAPE
jgi:hypothetical protein